VAVTVSMGLAVPVAVPAHDPSKPTLVIRVRLLARRRPSNRSSD
jgi:hypothetical protein